MTYLQPLVLIFFSRAGRDLEGEKGSGQGVLALGLV
jgi:hypothetical protein